jgi:membrane-associated phospholipid phosphatase
MVTGSLEYDAFSTWLASIDSPILTSISQAIDILIYPLLFIFLLYLAFVKKERKKAFIMGVTYLILIFLIFSLKFVFSEARPCTAPWKIQCPADSALPSGHAAAMAVLVIAYLTTSMFPPALLFYIIVSLSRIYLGIHVFKDVLAGTAIAFVVFLVVEKLFAPKFGRWFVEDKFKPGKTGVRSKK